jgi:hypothetical protein
MSDPAPSMVEQVALAIHAIGILAPADHSWEACAQKPAFRMAARAAIEAMRHPTEAMVKAAPNLRDVDFYPSDVWQAMIDGALR